MSTVNVIFFQNQSKILITEPLNQTPSNSKPFRFLFNTFPSKKPSLSRRPQINDLFARSLPSAKSKQPIISIVSAWDNAIRSLCTLYPLARRRQHTAHGRSSWRAPWATGAPEWQRLECPTIGSNKLDSHICSASGNIVAKLCIAGSPSPFADALRWASMRTDQIQVVYAVTNTRKTSASGMEHIKCIYSLMLYRWRVFGVWIYRPLLAPHDSAILVLDYRIGHATLFAFTLQP